MPLMSVPGAKRSWQVRVGRSGNRVDRDVGVPGGRRQYFQRVPGDDAFGRGEAGLAPVPVDAGVAWFAADRDGGEGVPDGLWDWRGAQGGHQDLAVPVHEAGDNAGQYGGRVAQQAAPVARMVRALAQRGLQG
jgi:hypothetical protein